MRCFLLAICLIALTPALAGASPLKLAYVKHGWLYTIRIDRAGRPIKGAKPERIRPVPAETEVSLVGSPDGRFVAMAFDTSVCVVSLASQKVVRWPDPAYNPSFSPDGKYLAFDNESYEHPAIFVLDIRAGRTHVLCKNAEEPFWSANGKEVAAVFQPNVPDGGGYEMTFNARTGKCDYKAETGINPTDPILSPDGSFFAVLHHLSRPITGHEITDVEIGDDIDEYFGEDVSYVPSWSAEPVLDAWSPTGKWLLWEWRFTDPRNDAMWLWQDIGLTSLSGHVKRRVGQGLDACFSPDGRHVLWLQPKRKEDFRKPPYALMWKPFRGRAKRLVAGVDAYTVVGAYSDSRWMLPG